MKDKTMITFAEDQTKGEIGVDVNVHVLIKDRKLIIDVIPFDDIEMEKIIDGIRKLRKVHIELHGKMYDSIVNEQEYHRNDR